MDSQIFNIGLAFRSTYVRERINGSDILSGGVKNAYYHFSLIQDVWDEFWTKCLTYVPQHKVPPGDQHSVTEQRSDIYIYMSCEVQSEK